MKNKGIQKLFLLFFVSAFFMTGCTTPSPLYGTWSDNTGNQIKFLNDGSFSAKIYVPKENPGEDDEKYTVADFQGTYTTLENVLVINTGNAQFDTEWDLRGAILYLTWTTPTEEEGMKQVSLTLYHIAK